METDLARDLLRGEQWERLFVEELGWDRLGLNIDVSVPDPGTAGRAWPTRGVLERRSRLRGHDFQVVGIAHKRGVAVFVCSPYRQDRLPDYSLRSQIGTRIRASVHHHVLIFTNTANSKPRCRFSLRAIVNGR